MSQVSVGSAIQITGNGLHSGQPVSVELQPAEENTGIVFCSAEQPEAPLTADPECVVNTQLCTQIRGNGFQLATVEHLLAAIAGLEIDNIRIVVDGKELPILDGSSKLWVDACLKVGLHTQTAPRECWKILKPIEVTEGDKVARLLPSEQRQFQFTLSYGHPVTDASYDWTASPEHFITQIAPARTFGFYHQFEQLKAQGLAKGAGLHNAVGLTEDGVLNPEGLRFPDELVRHKILDALGDLALLNHPILGRYEGYKAGHGLNNQLARAVQAQIDHWTVINL